MTKYLAGLWPIGWAGTDR